MASKRDKQQGLWRQIRIWMHQNQRVVWVVVLILVCFTFGFVGPVQDFFTASAANKTYDRIWGRAVTEGDVKKLDERMRALYVLISQAGGALPEFQIRWMTLPLAGALQDVARALTESEDRLDFFVFREKALREGFRVSDAELAEYVRFLWERGEAARLAVQEVQALEERLRADPSAPKPGPWDFFSALSLREKELRAKPFDPRSWKAMVDKASGGRLLPADLEETLRDFLLVAKLERTVRDSVKVTPQEAFERFREERQKRKFVWAEFPVTEELEGAALKSVTDEEVRAQYDRENRKYAAGDTVKARWLLVPRKRFLDLAPSKVTEEDLVAYYRKYRNLYRKPAVSSLEASFYPLSAAEKAERDGKLFLSFEEVKDKVREKVVEETAAAEMREFARELSRRVAPPQTSGEAPARPATFSELVKEYPFLRTETTGFAEEADAREKFGAGYTRHVETWFRALSKYRQDASRGSGAQPPRIEAPKTPVENEEGLVFYADVEHRGPRIPTLREIQDRVRKDVVLAKCLDALREGLEDVAGKIDRGEATFEEAAKAPVEAVVRELDKETPKGRVAAKVAVTPRAVESSAEAAGKGDLVKVAREDAPPKAEAATEGEGKPEAGAETHPASSALVEAGFRAAGAGKAAVGTSDAARAAYLVRVDEIIPPNPEDFPKEKASFESQVLAQRQTAHFAEWRKRVRAEARGRAAPPDEGAFEKRAS